MAAKCASKTLFVGNLHASLEETDLLEIFRPFGRIVECCKRWCHYGFIQFATEDEAKLAFNNLNGSRVRGRPMRIEFQRKKIRNLAALLEAEAQSKLNVCGSIGGGSSSTTTNTDERGSPALIDDIENISPSTPLSYAQLFNNKSLSQQSQQLDTNIKNILNDDSNSNKKRLSDENLKYQTFELDLFKQLSFLDSDNNNSDSSIKSSSNSNLFGRKITNSLNTITNQNQPLGTRNLNISASSSTSSSTQQQKSSDNFGSIAKDVATNVLSGQNNKNNKNQQQQQQQPPIIKPSLSDESNAWINYLLDKASKCSSKSTKATFSLSSSPLSPNQRDSECLKSNSIENSLSSNSVNLYRSLNTSNTIFIQPTDILEPLEIGDFNEYKLFPTSNQLFKGLTMSSPNNNNKDHDYAKEIDILVELTPPSSVSLSSASSISSSCSSSSSSSSSSPILSARSKFRSTRHQITKC